MKKRLFALVLVAAMGLTLTAAGTGWTETQDTVHEIAEMARELGLPEDDPIIVRASEIWWEEQETKGMESDGNEEPEEAAPLLVYYGSCKITGYYGDGTTASGTRPTVGRTCATGVMSKGGLPFGTVVYIEGIGYRTVEDRGMGGSMWFDVYCNSRSECYALTGTYEVWVVKA